MEEKTNKELLLELLKEKYPERAIENEEELYRLIIDDYNNYEEEVRAYKEREQGLIDMFEKDPRSANFLTNWRKGADPIVELMRLFGPELREALDDPEKQEALAQAHQEFVDKVEQEREADEEYKMNLATSLENISQLQEEENLSDDEVEGAMLQLIAIVRDALKGIYTPETLQLVFKAINHDLDVETAAREAEIAGRNAKIAEQLRKPENDGTPPLAGANNSPTKRQRLASIFDLASLAQ